MFLAHRNGHVRTDYGSIFGYFTLDGVGILGEPKPGDLRRPPQRPLGPNPPTGDDEPSEDDWYVIPLDQALLEPERLCGPRFEDGAIYFVDALARHIDSKFAEALEEPAAVQGEAEADARTFREVVKRASPPPQPQVPEAIEGHTQRRGALVVLEPPFPSFQRIPQAAFRDLMRIDGCRLLKRIAAAYAQSDSNRRVKIAYYRTAPGKRKTKGQLVTDLAEDLQASKAFSGSIWKAFADLIATELGERQWMTLTGVGTFRVKTVNGSKQVTFKPSTMLGRKI